MGERFVVNSWLDHVSTQKLCCEACEADLAS